MLRFGIQFSMALILFLVSSLFTWYEGSAIIEDPWEWKYSTPFSHFFNGEVIKPSDISSLDHFVYAAKFHPLFPAVMILSLIYMLTLLIYYFLNKNRKQFIACMSTLGIGLILMSLMIFNSSTIGGQIYFYMLLGAGLVYLSISIVNYYKNLKLI